ncbi:branched-chain amino acid transport system carrier protein [Philodulcilactobacillus myokoensis]|uniref:Branched-chain amino acid transport system carrier protein n=1 Tax=Philodulcilactobacillus myokoensis TaxID=2929573 RepID=A0A9W6B1R4_9LACO|nr:branched-chain amino acid transport system II carrier protein [Philodulcilactobacillus myokoensis]GLB47058.1 branched-chain amino acid transport system carrier protein [Philodulcilactobacillus myokoensis]
MNIHLSKKQYIILSSLLFGLFFGAGNLIFPIHLGQLSNTNWIFATIGFLLSSILLPLLSIQAISKTESNSMFDLALPTGSIFAFIFMALTHLSLGVLIASPRTATVTYSMGIQPLLPTRDNQIGLFIFSLIFFGGSYWLAFKSNQITKYVGKFLNPVFILLILFLFILAFVIKGDFRNLPIISHNGQNASNLATGFLQGYNTMDALAGLGFGVAIIASLKFFGLKTKRQRSKAVSKIGMLTMGFEALIYIFLIALGVISLKYTSISANGGIAFTEIMKHYTGVFGAALLATLTLLACLTTEIGLISSLSQDWANRFPKLGYHFFLTLSTIGSFIIANFGLTKIITYSSPILELLYPIAIALIILGVLNRYLEQNQIIYKTTIIFTAIPAILDFIHSLPAPINQTAFVYHLSQWCNSSIPLFNVGLDFIPFMLFGLIISFIWVKIRKIA